MKLKFIFLVLLLVFCSCSKENNRVVNVKYNPRAELKLLDTLIFDNSKSSLYIGISRDIEVIGKRIYVSDRTNCKIHMFDQDMNYLKSSYGYGHGPGEFPSPPYLSRASMNLVVYCPGEGLRILDSNFSVIKKIKAPEKYMTNLANPVVFNKNKVLATGFSKPPMYTNKLSDITTAVLFDYDGTIIKSLCKFDEEYDENIDNSYFVSMSDALVSKGFDNTYIVLQLATLKYMQYDHNGNYLALIIMSQNILRKLHTSAVQKQKQ